MAASQKSLLTIDQLAAAGFSPSGVRSRVARGRLFRLQRSVYATHPPPYSREQRWLAAVLACGSGALLCGPPAALHWGIAEVPFRTVHVCSPKAAGRSRAGITAHRRTVDPRDVRKRDSIPCVSVDLVLIDLAANLSEAELETVLVAAESMHWLKRHRLNELVAERHGRPGIHKLESILELEPALTRSEQETLFLPICRLAGVERPRVNFPIPAPSQQKPLLVDFAWPAVRMVVEADSQRFHGDWERAEADRERDQLLAIAGWVCQRFVRGKLANDAGGSAERLRLLTEARVAELGAVSLSADGRSDPTA